MKRLVLMAIAMLHLLAAGCACVNPASYVLAVPLDAQQTSMWCWAAGGEMTMDFLGGAVDQCDEANKRFNRTDCCNNPVPAACVNGGWPEYAKYNFSADETTWGTALSWSQLAEQIHCKKKPVAFAWGWEGGGGHLMVAAGYASSVQKWVLNDNPWPPPNWDSSNPAGGDQSWITYDYFVASPGSHVHWRDYYNITKN